MRCILAAARCGPTTPRQAFCQNVPHLNDWAPIITANPAILSVSLRSLFPPGVLAAELRGPGDPAALYPDEADCLRGAVAKRAQEFAAGRLCARRLLSEFGIEDFPLKAAKDRQPLWPDSLVGSITHTAGFCAAVAARKNQIRAVGIDSELAASVKEELWRWICTPDETAWLRTLPARRASRCRDLDLLGQRGVL